MVSPLSDLALRASSAFTLPGRLLTCGRLPTHHRSYRSSHVSRAALSAYVPQYHGKARRRYATKAALDPPRNIAVLGGGLTGLTTAYYLTRFHPTAKVTLYEADSRLGGWLDTDPVNVRSVSEENQDWNDRFLFMERGARAVAPQTKQPKWEDFVFYELIHQLNCVEQVYSIPQDNPDIANRYIYYPDHLMPIPVIKSRQTSELLRLAYRVLTEPAFQGIGTAFWKLAKEQMNPPAPLPLPRKLAIAGFQDTSMGDFLQTLAGSPHLVNNLASAVIHGIWGGDIWKLSALEGTFQNIFLSRSLSLPQDEGKRIVKHSDYFSGSDILLRTPEVAELSNSYASASYLGFKKGFQSLAENLVTNLKRNPNVTIKTATPVTNIRYDEATKHTMVTTSESHKHDKVISSLYSGTLAKLTGNALPALKSSAAVTIQIVNLWYENVQLQTPGFGYLIPQSVPAENNPHAALGVIFDSDRDAAAGITTGPGRGTNLTVMLGGHYWDYLNPDSYPSEEDAIAMAKDTVQRHLGITATAPVHAFTKLCRDCIPQHLVGHRDRMTQAHEELSASFDGTLAVVGGSYTMPGVLPSLKAARDVALAVSGGGYLIDPALRTSTPHYDMKHVGDTGLGRFVGDNETFALTSLRELPFRFLNRSGQFNDPQLQE